MNIISTGYLHTEVIVLIRKIFNSVKMKDGNITSQCRKKIITLVYTEVPTQKCIISYFMTSNIHLLLQTVQY